MNRFHGVVTAALSIACLSYGFDAVSNSAGANDELSLTVSNIHGTTGTTAIKVTPRCPPRVVRTKPSTGRTDVALNLQVSKG